ncbi:MAG: YhbY family RNA-binding protein [Candidatus Enteromonas sp.]|jgi:RNA-binding protein|nr:YhbY family RNA-binding protein [Bacilli bacterium]MEE3299063.1 YhbY family RNA-binding protein [Candidatus Enteromonas sp.]MBQ2052855.1 YhbY family RNA-binding protein [Bacilli bacterium]MBQ4182898.1 YhbY family RNA-binding protein [Bacilli bacterium]MCR5092128.1 YhbY family RNA-binding protein [Bacilli bacterium]
MTLTPKQRAVLKGMANTIHDRYQFGKGEVDDAFVELIDKALEAKELIKVGLLQNAELTADEVAAELVKRLDCGLVQKIGRVIVLYRPSKKHPTIKI